MSIRLVTSHEIILHTPMGGNVDVDKYLHLIDDVQVLILENILGTKLYDKLLDDFDNDAVIDEYLVMLDEYVKPVMWHSVFAEYVKIGNIWINNGGHYEHTSEDSINATQDQIDSLSKTYESKADAYIKRLEKYLCAKGDVIPEYSYCQDESYDINAKVGLRTIGGLYFGK